MADLRLWSKEMLVDFIDMYKGYPCLWKVKSEQYKNKYWKAAAYKELTQFCKKRGFPEATRDFVVRKLQSLRGSFRKELRKTKQFQLEGKTYQSNLWYYNHLLFTKDVDSDDVDEGDQDDETSQSVEGCGEEAGDDDELSVDVKPSTENIDVQAYSADSLPSPPPLKRRRTEDCPQPEFLDIGLETSKYKDLSEFEITGMSIAKKLARMDTTQAIYAESIINNVIRKGLLKKLKEETDLCSNMCERRAAFSSKTMI